jgi:hypothetical protein
MKIYFRIVLILLCVFFAGNMYAQSRPTAAQAKLASRQPKRDNSAFYRHAAEMRQKAIQQKERQQQEIEANKIKSQQKKD